MRVATGQCSATAITIVAALTATSERVLSCVTEVSVLVGTLSKAISSKRPRGAAPSIR